MSQKQKCIQLESNENNKSFNKLSLGSSLCEEVPIVNSPTRDETGTSDAIPIFQATLSSFLFSICCIFIHLSPGSFFGETVKDSLCSVFVMSVGLCLYVFIKIPCDEMLLEGYFKVQPFNIHPNASRVIVCISAAFKCVLGIVVFAYEIKKVFKIEGFIIEIEMFTYIILLSHLFCTLFLINIAFCIRMEFNERSKRNLAEVKV